MPRQSPWVKRAWRCGVRSATKEAFAHTLLILGRVALAEHRYQDAANYCKESLGICQELGEKEGVALALESLAGVWAALRQAETAAKLLGSA